MKTIIRIFWRDKKLNIADRAYEIYKYHKQISLFFNQNEWFRGKSKISIMEEDFVVKEILDSFKKEIRKHTIIKNVDDDYIDNIRSSAIFFRSPKFDDDTTFTYELGYTDDNFKYSSLQIRDFHHIKLLKNYETMKAFIITLTELFQPENIQVSDYEFYRTIMDFDGSEYWFGWMTYLSKDISLPNIPSEIEMEELKNSTLLIVTKDFFDPKNNVHLSKAKALVESFRKEVH